MFEAEPWPKSARFPNLVTPGVVTHAPPHSTSKGNTSPCCALRHASLTRSLTPASPLNAWRWPNVGAACSEQTAPQFLMLLRAHLTMCCAEIGLCGFSRGA
eukprot:4600246-Pleurochrysis_carterae.AAC.2